ncbi:MAG: hypothetical protein AAF573_17365 [Bacteroidota bacterium]
MRFTFLLLFFFGVTSFALAQFHPHDHLPPQDPPTFSWGDRYYEKNIQGLGFLMTDLRTLDPDLYRTLRPRYEQLRQRNRTARSVGIVGGLAGSALMIAGVLDSRPRREAFGTNTISSASNGPEINYGMIGGGLLVFGAASIFYYQKTVRHADILNFVNYFNEKSYGEKIYFSIRPEVGLGNNLSGGVVLSWRF